MEKPSNTIEKKETIGPKGEITFTLPQGLMEDSSDPEKAKKEIQGQELRSLLEFGINNKDEKVALAGRMLAHRLIDHGLLSEASIEADSNSFGLIFQTHEIGKYFAELIKALYEQGTGKKAQIGTPEYKDYSSHLFEEMYRFSYRLNSLGAGKYSIFVPIVGATFNALDMTGGTPQTAITEVRSWGVKNRRGDTERKALVR